MTETAPKRLLIIDDEKDLREVLVSLLEQTNLHISLACNGAEGIQKLTSEKFDAVLSDEKMPQKSGLEVLKWMNETGLETPFIMHSGDGENGLAKEAQRLGAFAFIDKPWNERILLETVHRALRTQNG